MELEIIQLFAQLEIDIAKQYLLTDPISDLRRTRDAILTRLKSGSQISVELSGCTATLRSGRNQGLKCGRKPRIGSEYCGYHS